MQTLPASVGALGQQGQQNPYGDAFQDVGMDDFLKMMLTELQHQDPLNPMDNQQILQQISQIREIVSNDQMTETMQASFLGQNLATASNMIGNWIVAMADDGESVLAAGQVNQISIENGIPKLHVADRKIDLKDISLIQSEADAERLAAAMELVGRSIVAMTNATDSSLAQQVSGTVDRVSFRDGVVRLHIEDHVLDPENVLEVLDASTQTT